MLLVTRKREPSGTLLSCQGSENRKSRHHKLAPNRGTKPGPPAGSVYTWDWGRPLFAVSTVLIFVRSRYSAVLLHCSLVALGDAPSTHPEKEGKVKILSRARKGTRRAWRRIGAEVEADGRTNDRNRQADSKKERLRKRRRRQEDASEEEF